MNQHDIGRRLQLAHRVLAIMKLLVCIFTVSFVHGATTFESDSLTPPARVGQLSFLSGNVRMRVDRDSVWEQGVLNTPITTGSAVATQLPGRTEVRIGSTALRLGQESRVVWTEVNDKSIQIEIVNGLIALRVRTLLPNERLLLSVQGVKVEVNKPGSYRFRYGVEKARFQVWVLDGQARVISSQQSLTLDSDQQVQLDKGTASRLTVRASEEHQSFDEFADRRDRRTESSMALLHVSQEVTGVESLDGHGYWRDDVGYGAVWFPNKLPVDWAPYRFGRWRWLAPWGWTWIDNAPWGFAPFHYGRWLFAGGRWGWSPGRLAVANAPSRPVYAPALVVFFGNQTSAVWTLRDASTPIVGWYPLAHGEIYWPNYNTQIDYVRALHAATVSDTTLIQTPTTRTNVEPPHRFARTAFAATAMPYAAFINMQDVSSNQFYLPPAALAKAPLTGRRLQPPRPETATPLPTVPR